MESASSDSVPVDEINELLTCCMCLETLQEPRSLACFHNFCKVCLGEYYFLCLKGILDACFAWILYSLIIKYPSNASFIFAQWMLPWCINCAEVKGSIVCTARPSLTILNSVVVYWASSQEKVDEINALIHEKYAEFVGFH
jgi:hypothetical protein